jgi:hypothetical protein
MSSGLSPSPGRMRARPTESNLRNKVVLRREKNSHDNGPTLDDVGHDPNPMT